MNSHEASHNYSNPVVTVLQTSGNETVENQSDGRSFVNLFMRYVVSYPRWLHSLQYSHLLSLTDGPGLVRPSVFNSASPQPCLVRSVSCVGHVPILKTVARTT